MVSQHPEVIPIIRSWLSSSHKKIESFWIGAQWEKWARYELYMAIEQSLGSQCLVTHGMSELWQDGDEEVDVLVEPRDNSQNLIAIKLRCENVNENAGSYETFRDQMDADMLKLKGFGEVENGFEGVRLLLVGFSGEPSLEDAEFKTQPQPDHFAAGEVHCWIMQHDLPSTE